MLSDVSLAGRTEDEAFDWSIEALGKCLKRAEELGVILALETPTRGMAET